MGGRAGFTLVEALVSMLLSTLVVGLVTSVFLIQNEFYSDAVRRSALHESVRGATALVSSRLRGVAGSGIVAAESDSVTFRVPLVVGGVCGVIGAETYLLFPMNGRGVLGSDVAGYAVRDAVGSWSYTPAGWASIFRGSGAVPAQTCMMAGADTIGASADFFRLDGLVAIPPVQPGSLVMLYRERTLRLAVSGLDPASMALFSGPAGGTPAEYASGLTGSSRFEYRLVNETTWRTSVTGASRDLITAVRFRALGAAESARLGRDSLTFNLTVTVALRNAN